MRVCRRNGISIGSSVFAGLTGVPNTQTDEQTVSVSTGRQRLKTFLFQASFQVCRGYELGMGTGIEIPSHGRTVSFPDVIIDRR